MPRPPAPVCTAILALLMAGMLPAADIKDFAAPPHNYWTQPLKHRCSYMIDSSLWDGMHPIFKQSVEAKLWNALQETSTVRAFACLPATEKREIRRIIKETKAGLRSWWQ